MNIFIEEGLYVEKRRSIKTKQFTWILTYELEQQFP
jgi:hypothetical protein